MTRHRTEVVAAFLAGVLAALVVVSPAQARPSWFCERKPPGHHLCQPASTPGPTVRPTVLPTVTLTAPPTLVPTAVPTAAPTAPPTPAPTVLPTAAPTAPPTGAPTAAPTPIVTTAPTVAPPAGRPFPAPVTSRTVQAPTTGINAFLASVANGSIIEFPATATYDGLDIIGKSNLVLRGNGARLVLTGGGSKPDYSAFFLRDSHHIAIDGFTVEGGDPGPITSNRGENAHVLALSAWYGLGPSTFVELSNVRASHVYGDFAYLEGEVTGSVRPSAHVWIHHNQGTDIGRNGVSLINVTDVLIEHNDLTRISYHAIDFEPNLATEQVRRVTIRDNDIGSYAHRTDLIGYFVAARSFRDVPSEVSDVTIADNAVEGTAANGYNGKALGLLSKFVGTGVRYSNIRFTGNTTARVMNETFGAGGVLYFKDIDGVTVTGNVQPIVAGSTLARFDNCTNVTGP